MNKLINKISHIIFKFVQAFEVVVSLIIAIVVVFMLYNLIVSILKTDILAMNSAEFSSFLSSALTLVVGLEFVKLLCQHTPENLIDVLLLAISRQIVVEHHETFSLLLGILSIMCLLIARKFLSDLKKDP